MLHLILLAGAGLAVHLGAEDARAAHAVRARRTRTVVALVHNPAAAVALVVAAEHGSRAVRALALGGEAGALSQRRSRNTHVLVLERGGVGVGLGLVGCHVEHRERVGEEEKKNGELELAGAGEGLPSLSVAGAAWLQKREGVVRDGGVCS
jgi:hypothetical protein